MENSPSLKLHFVKAFPPRIIPWPGAIFNSYSIHKSSSEKDPEKTSKNSLAISGHSHYSK